MPRPSRRAVLLATEMARAPLAPAARGPTRPGEALRRATEAAGQGRTAAAAPDGEPAPSLGEQLQDAAEMARAAAAAVGASPVAPGPIGATPGGAPAAPVTAVVPHRRPVHPDGATVLSSAVPGQPVTTGDGVEAGRIRNLILSPALRVLGIALRTGVPGVAGRPIAIGADRPRVRDGVAGVSRLEASATQAPSHTTPDFTPGTAP